MGLLLGLLLKRFFITTRNSCKGREVCLSNKYELCPLAQILCWSESICALLKAFVKRLAMRISIDKLNFVSIVHILFIAGICVSSPIKQSLCERMVRCLPVRDHIYTNEEPITHLQSSHHLHPSELLELNTSPAIHTYRTYRTEPPNTRSSLIERGIASDLTFQGYRWLWKKAEVILDSIEAYKEYHSLYDEVTNQVKPSGDSIIQFAAQLVITYGSMRMTFNNLPSDHESAAAFIERFALEMLSLCTVGLIYGTYEIAVLAAKSTIWVMLQIIESGPIPELIG